ncbi:MAG: ABC transporter permease [Desulfobacteraceae bacterium]|nr:ABC transporter permease [Desulfobacteraceae bacterium]
MISYVLRRLIQFVPTIFGVTLIVFFLLNVLPGNAAMMAGGKNRIPPAAQKLMIKKWGLDQPVYARYFKYIKGLCTADLGTSFISGERVTDVLAPRLWPTFKLAVIALAIACVTGIPLGFYSALRQGTAMDTVTMIGAVSGVSMPQFWLGLLLMYFFSVYLKILPTVGYGNGDPKFIILPAITLGVGYMALLARTTRAAVVETLSQDYIRTARSKGISDLLINRRHVLRNTLTIILTSAGLQFGSLLGGTVVVETLFSWPGLGTMMVNSIYYRDTPITQGCVMIIIVGFLVINLLVDLSYALIDPRIKYQ